MYKTSIPHIYAIIWVINVMDTKTIELSRDAFSTNLQYFRGIQCTLAPNNYLLVGTSISSTFSSARLLILC